MKRCPLRKGQSVVEILIGIAVGAIFVMSAATIIAPSLRANQQANLVQTKAELATELSGNVKGLAAGNWNAILSLATGSLNTYYLLTTSSPFTVTSGVETVNVASTSYKRYFFLGDVYRDSNGNVTTTIAGNKYDPSTKQVAVVVNSTSTTASSTGYIFYLTRNSSVIFNQTSWAGGAGNNNAITNVGNTFAGATATVIIAGTIELPTTTIGVPGTLGTWATASSSLSQSDAFGAAVVATTTGGNTYIYVNGGITPYGNTSGTIQSLVNANGTLGAWVNSSTTMPSVLENQGFVFYNGYVYAIGGADASGNPTSTVFQAPINANGSLGTWAKSSTTLPGPLYRYSAVVYNGNIYTLGTSNLNIKPVYQATINANGSLGAWANASTTFPSALDFVSAVAYNGYIYTVGGQDYSLNPTSSVFQATINANGSLGAWAMASNTLPTALDENSAVAYNGYLYSTGGSVNAADSVLTSTVFEAPINGNGSLGTWTALSSALPNVLYAHSAVAYNNHIYTAGGGGPTSSILSVYQSTIPGGVSYVATGTLDSVTFDTGVASGVQLNSVIWQGTLPGGTHVGFQFAVSNTSSGPWNYEGPSGGSSDYFGYNNIAPNTSINFASTNNGYNLFSGYRYFRYRVTLFSDPAGASTPIVTQAAVNWSP